MPSCFAVGCAHDSRKDKCKFFRFPFPNAKDVKDWEKKCRRADRKVGFEDRICSCHFFQGKKENGPTLFKWNENKKLNFQSPEKKMKKKLSDQVDVATGSLTRELNIDTNFEELPCVSQQLSSVSSVSDAESYFLKKEITELQIQLSKAIINQATYNSVKCVPKLLYRYTGLPTPEHFELLLALIKRFELNYFNKWTVKQITLEDQLLCTLMKLRLNLPDFDLAYRFKVSATTIHNVVMTFVYAIHGILFKEMMKKIPSREKNALSLPDCFVDFPNCRITLDCTEIEIAVPNAMDKQKAVFSNYKQRHTFKVLVGVAPNGAITYVSELYPGSTSDKNITKTCGVLNHLVAGDLIIADKGFLISDLCSPLGVSVNIPPFLHRSQFTPDEIARTTKIARARVHVERAINRLKHFRILDFISVSMRSHASILVQTCAALVNLQNPILSEVQEEPSEQ